MEPMASGLIGEIRRLEAAGARRKTRDVIVATLVSAPPPPLASPIADRQDQRNHGERRRIRNKESFETNPGRL